MENELMMSVEDLKQITSISDNVDVEQLKPFIYNAQILFLKPVLSISLYDDILLSLSTGNTKYDVLLQSYVYPALAYYAWHNSAIFQLVKTTKKGLVKQSSDSSETIEMDEFAAYNKSIESMAVAYTNLLRDYLEDNKTLYPLYRGAGESVGDVKSSSSIYLGFKKN